MKYFCDNFDRSPKEIFSFRMCIKLTNIIGIHFAITISYQSGCVLFTCLSNREQSLMLTAESPFVFAHFSA